MLKPFCLMLCLAGVAMVVPTQALATNGRCPWVASKAPIPERVGQLLERMTLEQKMRMLHGTEDSPYAGEVPAIESLCIPALTMQDGPGGLADGMTGGTQLPAPITLAATWDTALAQRYAKVIGIESRGKGITVNLGPTLNLVRDPRWGRAFETYGEDPWLTGKMGIAYVRGVQGTGTMAQAKHLAVYNQETNRNTPADNVIIGERTLHELYLPQFATVIKQAHPASVMCSYNYLDGVAACEDAYTLKQVLRERWGYRGFIVSDWGGQHSTVASAKAGLNIEMPEAKYYGQALKQAVEQGVVPASTVDDLVRPILTQMFRFHLFGRDATGTPHAVVTTPAHVAVARTVAEQGTVLLKNADHILPLSTNKVHSVAVIGTDAGPTTVTVGGGSAHVIAGAVVTPYQGIVARASGKLRVRYAQGNTPLGEPVVLPAKYLTPASGKGQGLTGTFYANKALSGAAVATRETPTVHLNWDEKAPAAGMPVDGWSAAWSGALTPPATGRYTFALTSDDGSRLYVDGTLVVDNWGDHARATKSGTASLHAGQPVDIRVEFYDQAGEASVRLGWRMPGEAKLLRQARLAQAVDLAAASDVAVVFASDFLTEGMDQEDIRLSGNQDALIAAVAKANPNTIVVLHTGSAVAMPWLDSVKAVVEAWYAGQESGHAIAAVLFGDVNPSGKLPITFPRCLADVPASTRAQWPGVDGRVEYSEGLYMGYRWYDARDIEPLFAFGHGLSYSTFAFDNLRVMPRKITSSGNVRVSVEVTNTGHRRGAEVVQLYVGHPSGAGEPPRQLKGFDKVTLEPGQTRRVEFELSARAWATWNTDRDDWQVAAGVYRIMVGDSSAHLPERGTVKVSAGRKPPR